MSQSVEHVMKLTKNTPHLLLAGSVKMGVVSFILNSLKKKACIT